jgi:hypothetical protein
VGVIDVEVPVLGALVLAVGVAIIADPDAGDGVVGEEGEGA